MTFTGWTAAAAAAVASSWLVVGAQAPAPSTVRVLGIVARLPPTESGGSSRVEAAVPGWNRTQISPDESIVRFSRAPVGRSEAAGTTDRADSLGLSESWEIAHQMVREGALFAEPDIEADIPQGEPLLPINVCPPCPPDAVAKYPRGKNPIQRALSNPEWSLNADDGANVLGAWDLFADVPADAGRGVVIGHPDTGYTLHPEFYSSSFPTSGWDYLNNDADPRDELLTGLLRNPGHGTKTGSVIVSRRGSQLGADAPRWVSGVAPAASLVPLRVTEGVALGPQDAGKLRISSVRLAQAIFDVARGRRSTGESITKADVISISLGGLPSATLRAAVDFAASQNVIVVAAAGNQVRQVIFPGGYDSVMGVAASNVDSRPWKGSSRGRRVKITAPGESVWTAATAAQQMCLQASDGTSFATATTAGIAALWLSHHRQRGTPGFTNPEPGTIPTAFHAAVRSGFRTVSGWDTARYGPGIIDALKVLNAAAATSIPLGEAAGRTWCSSRDANAEVDALAAIVGERGTEPERIRRLLGVADPCRAASLANEVAAVYALSDRVAQEMDALADDATASDSRVRRVRDALLASTISATLRQALASANAR